MEHPARKITKIAREAEHLVLLALRGDGVGTAEIDCIHAVRRSFSLRRISEISRL